MAEKLEIVITADDKTGRSFKGLGAALGGIGKTAAVAFAAATVATAAFGVALAAVGVKGNAAFEQFETQFEVFLGAPELAQQRMEELAEFGRKTPFELPGIVEAEKVLLGFGLTGAQAINRVGFAAEDVRTIVQDVAAGTGKGMEEIALNIGKFTAGSTGEAIMRFQEMGIVTREELRAMGLEFAKSGELLSPLPEAAEVLLTVMQEKFGGMGDALSSTFSGMTSNLDDWIGDTLRTVSRPIFDVLKVQLATLLEFLDSPEAAGAIANFTGLLENLFGLVDVFTGSFSLDSFLQRITSGLSEAMQEISFFVSRLTDELSGLGAGDILQQTAINVATRVSDMEGSLDSLGAAHARTLGNLEGQMANAASSLTTGLAQIAAQYADQITSIEEGTADSRESIQERFLEAQDRIQQQIEDKTFSFEDRMAERRDKFQDRITDLEDKHGDKRADLVKQLADAETDEERAKLQAKIAEGDKAFEEESAKLKQREEREVARLQARQDRDIARLKEQFAREETEREKALEKADEQRDKALAKIGAKQAQQEQMLRESNARQLASTQQMIEAENEAFEEQSQTIRDLAAEDIAEMEKLAEARAEALGSDSIAETADQTLELIDATGELAEAIGELLDAMFGWQENNEDTVFSLDGAIKTVEFFTGIIDDMTFALEGLQRTGSVPALIADAFAKDLANLQLPPWLTPGSPTPLELGLRGINEEASVTAAILPQLIATGGNGPITNTTNNIVNATINSNAPTSQLIQDMRLLQVMAGSR